MTETSQTTGSAFDIVKLLTSLAVLCAGIVGFYWFADQPAYFRVPGLLVATAIAFFIFLMTNNGKSIWGYIQGSRTEVRKMVWPTRKETVQTTITIFIVVLILGIFLWLVDMVLLWGVRYLTGQG